MSDTDLKRLIEHLEATGEKLFCSPCRTGDVARVCAELTQRGHQWLVCAGESYAAMLIISDCPSLRSRTLCCVQYEIHAHQLRAIVAQSHTEPRLSPDWGRFVELPLARTTSRVATRNGHMTASVSPSQQRDARDAYMTEEVR